MKICLYNINPKVGNKKKNIKKMEKVMSLVEADIYVFGEMSLTGYVCREDVFSLAEGGDGESIKELQEISRERDAAIIFGMPLSEREGIVYNAAVLVDGDEVHIYKKNFLANFGPFEEKFYFSPGKDAPVFRTRGMNIGMCICYDIFFPELSKTMALKGADMLVCISASPTISKEHFERVLPARATENTVFMAYCNLVGEQDGLTFWGGSQIYSPKGNMMARAEYMKEGHVVQEIDMNILREARIARPTLRDTKAEKFLLAFNAAEGGHVFSDKVKKGMEMAKKAQGRRWKEVEVHGNEDVAYGIKLVLGDLKAKIVKSDDVKAIFRDAEGELEVRGNE